MLSFFLWYLIIIMHLLMPPLSISRGFRGRREAGALGYSDIKDFAPDSCASLYGAL